MYKNKIKIFLKNEKEKTGETDKNNKKSSATMYEWNLELKNVPWC